MFTPILSALRACIRSFCGPGATRFARAPGYPIAAPPALRMTAPPALRMSVFATTTPALRMTAFATTTPALRTTKPRRCVTIVTFNFVKETFCNALSGNYDSSDARGFDAAWV
jgi:hypothetical protein